MSDTLRVSWKQNIIGRKFSSRNVNSVSSLDHYAVESYVIELPIKELFCQQPAELYDDIIQNQLALESWEQLHGTARATKNRVRSFG